MNKRSIKEINKKIANGNASVFTAEEFKEKIVNNKIPKFSEVDVVTTGTCGIMSGTAAILHFQALEPGSFKTAQKVFLNGVPAFPGPCPNEWLGSLDLFVYGTSKSVNDKYYGGGFLFNDLLNGKEIEVEIKDINGNTLKSKISLDEMILAKLIGTRMAFKNYTAFTNPSSEETSSIFNAIPMEGPYKTLSFSGCGDINPIQNDPNLETIKTSTKVLLNGSLGMVLGNGTRSSIEKPNLMLTADMKEMSKHYLGGFKTPSGSEVFNTVGIPIPILNDEILNNISVLNKDIPITISDINGRHIPLSETNYQVLWDDRDDRPLFKYNKCISCEKCQVEEKCPTFAFNNKEIDGGKCFGCGLCSRICISEAFEMNLGDVTFKTKDNLHTVDIGCRQSDKLRAKKISNDLKKMIINKEFYF